MVWNKTAMTNRIILGINLVLVVAVLLLSFATLSINRTLQSLSGRIAVPEPTTEISTSSSGPSPAGAQGDRDIALNPELAAELRQLIRDELRARGSFSIDGSAPADESASGSGGSEPRDAAGIDETAWQSVLVEQEIDFYINRGVISATEMSALQSEIAKLGPEGRVEAMRRLVGAINAGELDGRL